MIGWCRGLRAIGVDVRLLVVGQGRIEDHQEFEPVRIPLAAWQPFDYEGLDPAVRAYRLLPKLRAYWGLLRSLKPDVVIIRGLTPAYILMALPVLLWSSKIMLYTQGSRLRKRGLMTWAKNTLLLTLCGGRWFTPVTGLGRGTANRDASAKLWEDRRIKIIPFAHSVAKNIECRTWREGSPRLLLIGKFEARKNHKLAVEALQFLDPAVRLTLVGECSNAQHERYLMEVKELIRSVGLDARVTILTNVDHDQVSSIYSKHDIFLMISKSEPASVSHLEAMSHGLAVVIGRDNGTADYVQNGVNGYETEYDASEVADSIRSIVRQGVKLCGLQSLELVRRRHDERSLATKILELSSAQ
jgi:glycosyltransferase involved in cell wall biosynthesis